MGDGFNGLIWLAFCVILVPFLTGLAGYRLGERAERRRQQRLSSPSPALDRSRTMPDERDGEPVLTPSQSRKLQQVAGPTRTVPDQPPEPAVADTTASPPAREAPARSPLVEPEPGPESPVAHGRELDPAVMLLYVGALMIVAAGVIYAAYNWSDFSALAKLGSLVAVTVAFIAAGFGFSRSTRLRPAATTFLTIGALLVPTNAIAAWQVLDGAHARPALPLFFGALATALVHGAFSIRPGGKLYDSFAVFATGIAALSLPAAMGTDDRWGAPLALAVIAGVPVLRGGLAQLNGPRLIVSLLAAPFTMAAAISTLGAEGPERWVLPVTLVVATFALLRVHLFAPRFRAPAEALATVTALAVVPTALVAFDPASDRTWATVTVVTGIVWTLGLSLVPMFRRWHVALPMAIESFFVFTAGYVMFRDIGDHGFASIVSLSAVVAMTWIAWTHRWRWFLLGSAWFLLGTWSATAFTFDIDDASPLDRLRFNALYPLATMLGGLAVHRWWHAGARAAAALPLWIVTIAAGTSVSAGGVTLAIDNPSHIPSVIAILAVFAVLSLVVAFPTRMTPFLFAYGALLCVILGLAVEQWVRDDLALPAYVTGLALVALPSLPGIRERLGGPLAVFSSPRPRQELVPLGLTASLAFLGIVSLSISSIIATYTRPEGNDAELATSTWLAHLAIVGTALAASLWAGSHVPRGPGDTPQVRSLALLEWAPLALATLLVASVTSMLTRDIVHATWAWLAATVAFSALPSVWQPDTPYLRAVRTTLSIGGPVLLGATVLLNLNVAAGPETDGHLLGQIVAYTALAAVAGAVAARRRSTNEVYAASASLTAACWFATRYADADTRATLLAFIALAWVVASGGIIALSRRRSAFAGWPLLLSALAISAVAGGLVLMNEAAAGDALRALTVYWLVSLAGLLFILAWIARRRDLAFIASALAMAALVLQIDAREPDNIHAYTVPIAAWLLSLGVIERTHSTRANALLGAGATFLVVPGLWLAEQTGAFRWLLIGLVEGIALFLAGLALRLRIPIAAGVVTLSVIVLRMLLDVVNALPNWAALLTAGLILLLGGTVWISFRDELRARLAAIRSRLGPLD